MEDMKRSILIDYNLNGYASFNMNDQEYNNLGEGDGFDDGQDNDNDYD